jgi:hypothetical protein
MPFDGSRRETIASRIREFYGLNGEKWCRWTTDDGKGRHCLFGAFTHIKGFVTTSLLYAKQAVDIVDPDKQRIRRLGKPRVFNDGYNIETNIPTDVGRIVNYNNAAESYEDIRKLLDVMEEIEIREMADASR